MIRELLDNRGTRAAAKDVVDGDLGLLASFSVCFGIKFGHPLDLVHGSYCFPSEASWRNAFPVACNFPFLVVDCFQKDPRIVVFELVVPQSCKKIDLIQEGFHAAPDPVIQEKQEFLPPGSILFSFLVELDLLLDFGLEFCPLVHEITKESTQAHPISQTVMCSKKQQGFDSSFSAAIVCSNTCRNRARLSHSSPRGRPGLPQSGI
mmetsp:Transcript_20913/g.43062  ORF Transcript_20913/g.43062 Transcript_20913/m.43062 type:complete len:206 (+) Transcript_20913:708-1325(+)